MLGYSTGREGKYHFALVRRSNDADVGTPKLWVMPRVACHLDAVSQPAGEADELHFEYQRFALCKYGITIALSQHPLDLGCLLYGIRTNDERGLQIPECGKASDASSCVLKRILKEIGIEQVQLEYPRSNNLQRCLDSCIEALDSCRTRCCCTLPR